MGKDHQPPKTGQSNKEMMATSTPLEYLRTLPTVISLLVSITSVVYCLLLNVKTAVLQDRVKLLEDQKGSISPQAIGEISWDDATLLSVLQKRMDRLQEELTDGVAKIRTVREATSECLCPPGPPGKRGKTGRRGVIGESCLICQNQVHIFTQAAEQQISLEVTF
ncbi:hypothetical protein scyTo_0005985 [Scyliorhinus torazame]|uniref:Uncharacterized protein n=1 Tax=Scyliorhinus torazame TaxID=75743 RepID=A0A401PEM7_SCYTO|nr:hypothetical protein [Scyliorhinus torazame]